MIYIMNQSDREEAVKGGVGGENDAGHFDLVFVKGGKVSFNLWSWYRVQGRHKLTDKATNQCLECPSWRFPATCSGEHIALIASVYN